MEQGGGPRPPAPDGVVRGPSSAGAPRTAVLRGRGRLLSGEGAAFCGGLDLAIFKGMEAGGMAGGAPDGRRLAERTHGAMNDYQKMTLVWRDVPVPVIAALHGVAFGGGLQIAMAADYRLATADVRLSVMEIEWGIIPDCGGTLLMRELVSEGQMRELTYTGRIFSGTEALEMGLVNRVVRDPRAEALASAGLIAGKNPGAVRACKRIFNAAAARSAAEMLLAESEEQDSLLGSPNQREAVAAKLAGRPPCFAD
jgi:enoyl-CoA hydratase/carnithine racemase